MTKRILAVLVVATMLLVAGVHRADAHVGISFGFGFPGVYVGPPVVYSAPAYYYPPPPVYYPSYYYGYGPAYYGYGPYYGGEVFVGGRFGHRGHFGHFGHRFRHDGRHFHR